MLLPCFVRTQLPVELRWVCHPRRYTKWENSQQIDKKTIEFYFFSHRLFVLTYFMKRYKNLKNYTKEYFEISC